MNAHHIALTLYVPALAAAVGAVWRRPVLALYAFVVGLAAHNLVMALLYDAGVRGHSLEVIQAWKEVLLATAVASVALRAWRERRLPFRPGTVDVLALAFAAVAVLYALIPQDLLDGRAGPRAVLHGLRHWLIPVVVYLLGRSLVLAGPQLRRLAWTLVGATGIMAAGGLIDLYALDVEWWRGSGALGYYRDQLTIEYHGPGGLPDNWAFNSSEGVFRRLVSSFISPLAAGFMCVVALLLVASPGFARGRARVLAVAIGTVVAVALLFTLSRSSALALAVGLLVLAYARRRPILAAAAVGALAVAVGFAFLFTHVAPRTHFFPEDLAYQREQAKKKGRLPPGSGFLDPSEPSIKSHLTNLRDGLETVARHPQGYGLGNAGYTASRFDVPLKAGESNYTEAGVETGVVGMALFVAWNLALLTALIRAARRAEDVTERWAAGGMAAALTAVLALAVQTDATGVPWLAYCVWWLGGALVVAGAARAPALSRTSAAPAPGATPAG